MKSDIDAQQDNCLLSCQEVLEIVARRDGAW